MTATLLPNGEQVFLDDNGDPLALGLVTFYVPSSSTPKNTWQNAGKTVLNTNPVELDAAGRAVIYGEGSYRQVVTDALGNLIWDRPTQDGVAAVESADLTFAGEVVFDNDATFNGANTFAGSAEFDATTAFNATLESHGLASFAASAEFLDSVSMTGPVSGAALASQAQMEAASSTSTLTTPGRTQYHPGVAKFWARVANNGSAATLTAGHNVASVSRTGTGVVTVTLSTPYSGTTGACAIAVTDDAGVIAGVAVTSASVITVNTSNVGSAPDDQNFYVVGFGDQ